MISVVIPTRDRAGRLRALLDSIEGADEVIVVPDRPSPAVERVLAAAAVRVARSEGIGPAAARNSGWRAASGDLIAFVDDDCVAAPGWLAALRSAATADDVFVQGRVEPHPEEAARIGPFARTLRVDGPGPFFQTANILYPRALLERLGGFDEGYPYPAGEDTDLGWRALEAGARPVFASGALVWHAVHAMGPAALARDAHRWGSAVRVVKRHPGLRAHFHRRVFWKRSHERLLLACLGAGLAGRTRGRSLALAVPWMLEHRAEHGGAADLARALPAHLAVDGAELAAMLEGSVRARTLFV